MATGTAVDVVMPQMGVSVAEGTVTKWLKSVGDTIEADEPLLEISTDKVDTEVPSPGTGVLAEILVQEGETVDVGTLLGRIGGEVTDGAAPSEPPAAAAAPEPATHAAADAAAASASEGIARAPEAEQPLSPPTETTAVDEGRQDADGHVFVSPVVARIAAEHGVDPADVEGTGSGGRVTKKDILAFVEASASTAATEAPPPTPSVPDQVSPPVAPEAAPVQQAPSPAAPPPPAVAPPPAPAAPEPPTPAAPRPTPAAAPPEPQALALGEADEPMTPMRRGIAEHMRRSLDTSAHITVAFEVDMSRVVALRTKLKEEYSQKHGANLTYLAFISRAVVDTLRNWPWLNGEIRGDRIVTKSFVNLGFAVALDGGKGLIVPVVKNAETLNLLGLAKAITDVAERARSKKLMPDDVHGGTFTITNPGGWGAILGTPIISQPQVGILDTEALVKRPWVVQDDNGNDVIAIRPIMNLCLSYDHRLVDGAYAAQFMKELREKLESWDEPAY
jgi:pyruvate dehydrogenase E2 component (dihydrolipoyllysine-residue acetyltransferase)